MRTLLVLALAASIAAASASAEEAASQADGGGAAPAAEAAAARPDGLAGEPAAAIDRDLVARLLPGFYPEDAAPHSEAGASQSVSAQSVSPDDLTAALVDYAGCQALGEALASELGRVAASEREAAAEAPQGD